MFKTIERANGWIILIGNIKFGNTPPIAIDKISHFTYYSDKNKGDDHGNYILFNTLGGEARWYFQDKEKAIETYGELLELLGSRTFIK